MVHYPLIATSTGTVISYICQWIHNKLLSPQGVTWNGATNHSTYWAMQSQRASSFSPQPRFQSILWSHFVGLVASKSPLTISFPHDICSVCHAQYPAPHSWLCNQRSLPIQRSIPYTVLWCGIRTPCVSTVSIGMINVQGWISLFYFSSRLSTHWIYHKPSCSLTSN